MDGSGLAGLAGNDSFPEWDKNKPSQPSSRQVLRPACLFSLGVVGDARDEQSCYECSPQILGWLSVGMNAGMTCPLDWI